MSNNKINPFSVVAMGTTFPDYETYALFYPKNAGHSIDRFVKITKDGKSIIRKCSGQNGLNANEIALGYKTLQELNAKVGDVVSVKPVGFFNYYWNNSEGYTEWVFRIAIIGFSLTVLEAIISLTRFLLSLF